MCAQRILPVTDDTFDREVVKSGIPVVVLFHATWCEPCKELGPRILRAAEAYQGRVKVVGIDVDDVPKVPAMYNLRGVPMMLFLHQGKETDRIVGAVEESVIVSAFAKLASVLP